MASELKPCPFCGTTAKLNKYYGGTAFTVVCDNLHRINTFETEAEAVATWNTRPAPAATDTVLETVDDGYLDNAGRLSRGSHTDCIALGFRRVSLVDRLQAQVSIKSWDEAFDRLCDDMKVLRSQTEALEADNAAVSAALGALDNALAIIGGCGDGNCIVVKPKGQHTNGGCRCSQNFRTMQRFAFAMNQFRDVVARACEASK
jgi:hypothetical protein